jgi:hypothetical protein
MNYRFDIRGIAPSHERFVGGVSEYLAPASTMLVEMRR